MTKFYKNSEGRVFKATPAIAKQGRKGKFGLLPVDDVLGEREYNAQNPTPDEAPKSEDELRAEIREQVLAEEKERIRAEILAEQNDVPLLDEPPAESGAELSLEQLKRLADINTISFANNIGIDALKKKLTDAGVEL